MQDFATTALKFGQGAGNLAGEASVTALFATVKTIGFVGMAFRSSLKTFEDLGYAFRLSQPGVPGPQAPNASPASPAYLAGYSPSEKEVSCAGCGQKTLIRGNLPGRKIICPACGKTLIS